MTSADIARPTNTRLSLHAHIDYKLACPTDLLLQIEAAVLPEQRIDKAWIDISPVAHFARVSGHDGIGDRIWLRADQRLTVDYTATIEIQRIVRDVAGLAAVPMHQLPGETVEYLFGSRYCPVETFAALVDDEFPGTQGGDRIAAIRDWIGQHIAYRAGSSDSQTDALVTYVSREGVCRDFAHVMIALARASNIPARFASVFAPRVTPPDFHAVAEVFLAGEWHLVDATGMAHEGEMAKIGVGRDAADVSFLTVFGSAEMLRQQVEVVQI
ncbi:transglutaminase-like domain-containing protein [Parablastomonas sp. CN1-191]|uniref:transglutaminase-like domain-containing protein n=1 Tax=Parablastomonas sp. CN1-191 TaxID=3400908 RepID=UPI003BF8BA54